jgi:hypothetical protein
MPPRQAKPSPAGVIVTVVAVVVVLACLGFGTVAFFTLRHDDSVERAEGRPGSSPTESPLPATAPDTGEATHVGDITRFIVDVPAGGHPWAGADADGPVDINAAAADFANPAEGRRILRDYHFQDGYARHWVDGDNNHITVRVLRFKSPGDGDNFTNAYIDASQGEGWGTPQPVPGLDTAAGFVQPKASDTGVQSSLAVGDSGDIVATVLADQKAPADPSVPDDELVEEFGLL